MLPSTSPEAAAAASVLVNGGFDPFQYVQLPDGYTAATSGASKAYKMFNGSYTWADARQACEADGAQIAMPKTVTDMRDILGRNGKRISRREVIGVHNSFYSHRPFSQSIKTPYGKEPFYAKGKMPRAMVIFWTS